MRAFILSKFDGTSRLVFTAPDLDAATMFKIENRFETTPYVAATPLRNGIVPIDPHTPARCIEKDVPSGVVDDTPHADPEFLEFVTKALVSSAEAHEGDIRGWRVTTKDGGYHVAVFDRSLEEGDAIACLKVLRPDIVRIGRVIGGSYAPDPAVAISDAVYGPSIDAPSSRPSLRL